MFYSILAVTPLNEDWFSTYFPIANKLVIKYGGKYLARTVKPMAIATTTLGAFRESKLSEDVSKGIFKPTTEFEVLEEQKKLTSLIDVKVLYLGIHSINTVPFDVKLSEDREKAVNFIDKNIDKLDKEFLNSIQKINSI